MKVTAEVRTSRERPATYNGEPNRNVHELEVKLRIEATRGEPVVGMVEKVLDGARRAMIETRQG